MDAARRQAEESRDSLGRFRPGNAIGKGYGRPKGSIDLMAVVRRKAREEGLDLRQELWRVVLVLLRAAQEGDVQAGKLLLDRICGPIEKGTELSVSVSQHLGPVPPPTADLPAYAARLAELAQKYGAPLAEQMAPAEPWGVGYEPREPELEPEKAAAEPEQALQLDRSTLPGGPPDPRRASLAPRARFFVD